MKTLLASFLFIVLWIPMGAQNLEQNYFIRHKEVRKSAESPILIINNEIIGNSILFKIFSKEDVLAVEVIKDGQLSSTKLYIGDSLQSGILKIKTDIKIDIKTQWELNMFFGLKEDSDIYVNKYLIDKKHVISAESIKSIEVMKADGIVLRTTSLNIEI